MKVLAIGILICAQAWASDPMITDPVQIIVNRNIHRVMPFHQDDEAYFAFAHGQMTEQQKNQLMEGSAEDYFHDMDYGITNPANQDYLQKVLQVYIPGISKADAVKRVARGRNNWLLWTAGNDRFWNYMTRATIGNLDFLKTISSKPDLPATRSNRWEILGLVNEPCFTKSDGPQADRWGLWLDKRSKDCPSDPFADYAKYPGVKIGARGTSLIYKGKKKYFEVGSFYGYPTGVVGLRLFTNPDFDQKAADAWDPVRYYNDPTYFNNPNLVKPYRVGMACAFCHVGPNPSHPPADFNNPKWENLNANAGGQYFWVDRIFAWDYKNNEDSFVYQLLHTSRPGSLDTSLVSSDQINNPRTMNAVYNLPARVALAAKMNSREQLQGLETRNSQFSLLSETLVPQISGLRSLYNTSNHTVLSPRVLKDGSDSVGALGALNRVFVNIGLFSEEWVQNFIPMIGGVPLYPITPFRLDVADSKSLFWQATVNQTPDLALFFLAASRPDKLAEAPHGKNYLEDYNSSEVTRGKQVFAQTCARCHSSKLPEKAYTFFNQVGSPNACIGDNYLKCWNQYWSYSKTDEFKSEMEKIVLQPNFLDNNFLSTELRIPANLTDGYLCSPIGTNAIKDNIWDNFSSSSYKNLPSVGRFTVNFPYGNGTSMASQDIDVEAGGRGFMRPPSLISLWATAPFLQNNTVGHFDLHGTVEGRMSSFDDSIKKLLNPDLRGYGTRKGERVVTYKTSFGDQIPSGVMDVLTTTSYLNIPKGYLPNSIVRFILEKLTQEQVSEVLVKGPSYAAVETYRPDENWSVVSQAPPPKNWWQRMFGFLSSSNRQPAAEYGDGPMAEYATKESADYIKLGPIPAGVPINLISSIHLANADVGSLKNAIQSLASATFQIKSQKLQGDAARDLFMEVAGPALLKVSACTDFVVNRGHYFGTRYFKEEANSALSDPDQKALIEFLKHM